MNQELSNQMSCISIRNGVEIWLETDRASSLVKLLTAPNPPQFVEFDGRLINRADLVGVFTAIDMAEVNRRKNGQWKCVENNWHARDIKCYCVEERQRNEEKQKERARDVELAATPRNLPALDALRKTVKGF